MKYFEMKIDTGKGEINGFLTVTISELINGKTEVNYDGLSPKENGYSINKSFQVASYSIGIGKAMSYIKRSELVFKNISTRTIECN